VTPNACPYRAAHEWDEDGLCRHCFAKRPEGDQDTIPTPPHEYPILPSWVGPSAMLSCTICNAPGSMWPLGPTKWATRCHEHRPGKPTPKHKHEWVALTNRDAMGCRHCNGVLNGLQLLSQSNYPPMGLIDSPEVQQWLSEVFDRLGQYMDLK